MNLQQMQKDQAALDALIIKNHEIKLNNNQVLTMSMVATIAELGEMINEWRGFKFWSINQQPSDKLLEECVDCVHFFLSIANQIGLTLNDKEQTMRYDTPEMQFLAVNSNLSKVFLSLSTNQQINKESFNTTFNIFLDLMTQHFGFTYKEINEAYYKKHNINYERQLNNY